MRTAFNVLNKVNNEINFNNVVNTLHWGTERINRHKKIVENLGSGNLLGSFEVDTEHPNGYEIHNVFDNGVILIQNENTGRLVTELIARPQQLKRYWNGLRLPYPIELYQTLNKAEENQRKGYNYW